MEKYFFKKSNYCRFINWNYYYCCNKRKVIQLIFKQNLSIL